MAGTFAENLIKGMMTREHFKGLEFQREQDRLNNLLLENRLKDMDLARKKEEQNLSFLGTLFKKNPDLIEPYMKTKVMGMSWGETGYKTPEEQSLANREAVLGKMGGVIQPQLEKGGLPKWSMPFVMPGITKGMAEGKIPSVLEPYLKPPEVVKPEKETEADKLARYVNMAEQGKLKNPQARSYVKTKGYNPDTGEKIQEGKNFNLSEEDRILNEVMENPAPSPTEETGKPKTFYGATTLTELDSTLAQSTKLTKEAKDKIKADAIAHGLK